MQLWRISLLSGYMLLSCSSNELIAGRRVVVDGKVLRSSAVYTELPTYPEIDVRNHIGGLVAAEITVRTDGSVGIVNIIQQPDQSIGQALAQALKRWRFTPARSMTGELFECTGRLLFYFTIEGGVGHVIDANEAALQRVNRGKVNTK